MTSLESTIFRPGKYTAAVFVVMALALIWVAPASAYPTWSATNGAAPTPNTGNCADCHGDFRDNHSYSSLAADDPFLWGLSLMNGHQGMTSTVCHDCHTPPPLQDPPLPLYWPVKLNSANNGSSCMKCHGRAGDDTGDGLYGDGLRARHAGRAGPDGDGFVCADCHSDTTPVGENVPPPAYPTGLLLDPCTDIYLGN